MQREIIRQDRLIAFVLFESEIEVVLNASDNRIFHWRGAPLFYVNTNKPHSLQDTNFVRWPHVISEEGGRCAPPVPPPPDPPLKQQTHNPSEPAFLYVYAGRLSVSNLSQASIFHLSLAVLAIG